MTIPAPMQCSQLPVVRSFHAELTLLNTIEKDATYNEGKH